MCTSLDHCKRLKFNFPAAKNKLLEFSTGPDWHVYRIREHLCYKLNHRHHHYIIILKSK